MTGRVGRGTNWRRLRQLLPSGAYGGSEGTVTPTHYPDRCVASRGLGAPSSQVFSLFTLLCPTHLWSSGQAVATSVEIAALPSTAT
jgi:hypothetical protein